jgi:hypothetical protein
MTNIITPELLKLPALSIRQPWAWAILMADKDIENRCWPTRFRGRFLIHAAKGCTQNEYLEAKTFILHTANNEHHDKNIIFPEWENLKRGGIIGVAEIAGCVENSDSPWFAGPFGFVIRNAQPLEIFPCRGSLGFFHIKNQKA